MAYSVLQLPEGGDFEALHYQPSRNFDRSTKLDLTNELPLLGSCCYRAFFFPLWSLSVLNIESASLVPVDTSFESTLNCSLQATSSV